MISWDCDRERDLLIAATFNLGYDSLAVDRAFLFFSNAAITLASRERAGTIYEVKNKSLLHEMVFDPIESFMLRGQAVRMQWSSELSAVKPVNETWVM
jgi:hypothetical protein